MPSHLPTIVTVIAAAALGLFWLPLRALAESGLDAGLATMAVFIMPILVLVPLACLRLVRGKAIGLAQGITGLLTGGALALYSESLLHTDVARTLILFYVTPVWSTLLEVFLLKQRLSRARAIALILGLAGLVTILGGRTGVPLPQNLGDAMALLAGIVWAVGSFRVRLAPDVSVFENLFSFFFLWKFDSSCYRPPPDHTHFGHTNMDHPQAFVALAHLAGCRLYDPNLLGNLMGIKTH